MVVVIAVLVSGEIEFVAAMVRQGGMAAACEPDDDRCVLPAGSCLMKLHVSVTKSALATAKRPYRAVLHPGKRRTYEEFVRFATLSSTVSPADLEATVSLMVQWLEDTASSGQECDLGPLGRSRLGVKGSFARVPRRLLAKDLRLTLSWIFPRRLQERVAVLAAKGSVRKVETKAQAPVVRVVRAYNSEARAWVADAWQAGSILHIKGINLKFDPDDPEVGVFLQSQTGTAVRLGSYLGVFDRNVQVEVPESLAGSQRLRMEMRRRNRRGGLESSVWPAMLSELELG